MSRREEDKSNGEADELAQPSTKLQRIDDEFAKQLSLDATKAIHMRLVRSATELTEADAGTFHPEYTYVHFGQDELIYGYRNVRVDILYSAAWLHTFVKQTAADAIDVPIGVLRRLAPDDVDVSESPLAKVMHHYPESTLHDMDEFKLQLENEATFHPFGVLATVYEAESELFCFGIVCKSRIRQWELALLDFL